MSPLTDALANEIVAIEPWSPWPLAFPAVIALWARIPEYRWLAHVFSWTPLRAVCESLYDHVVAPGLAQWARVRQTGEVK